MDIQAPDMLVHHIKESLKHNYMHPRARAYKQAEKELKARGVMDPTLEEIHDMACVSTDHHDGYWGF